MPTIVTVSHFSTRIAAERAAKAAKAGASLLMLMPPYHGAGLRADVTGMTEHFSRIAEAGGIPIMVQDAPLSGVPLPVAFLARLAREVPLVRYFKIEVAGAAAKLRGLLAAGGELIEGPFDGEESITLMADLDAGATGTMSSALLPDLIKPVLESKALPLDTPEFFEQIVKYTSARRVPVLLDGEARIWDSLAIVEYLNEKLGGRAWPADPLLRSH